ncbi:hypothetical protein, partial [Lysinibacillus sp. NPDC056185]|uniref:hypothetical protein n=1 Tax=Lysinibacillus sp. NPDC056185 TaxID=3345739 RepID=UPI0039EF35DC
MVKLLPTDEHAWKIDCIIRTLNFDSREDSWEHISSWLQMASGLDEVNLITEKFDSSINYCSSALFFENERSAMLSTLAKELSFFNFVWGAFESTLETLEPLIEGCNIESHGKIRATSYILRKKQVPLLSGYTESLNKLQTLFKTLISKNINYDHITFKGKGIYIVSKIRNQFAHGALSLPSDLTVNAFVGASKMLKEQKDAHLSRAMTMYGDYL